MIREVMMADDKLDYIIKVSFRIGLERLGSVWLYLWAR